MSKSVLLSVSALALVATLAMVFWAAPEKGAAKPALKCVLGDAGGK